MQSIIQDDIDAAAQSYDDEVESRQSSHDSLLAYWEDQKLAAAQAVVDQQVVLDTAQAILTRWNNEELGFRYPDQYRTNLEQNIIDNQTYLDTVLAEVAALVADTA